MSFDTTIVLFYVRTKQRRERGKQTLMKQFFHSANHNLVTKNAIENQILKHFFISHILCN